MKMPTKVENAMKIDQKIRPYRVFIFRNWIKFSVLGPMTHPDV